MENLSNNDDFQEVTSAIPGISVFAPKPKVDERRNAQTYTCPQCGGHLAYNLVTSGLACQYCGYQATVQARPLGPVAGNREFTVDTMKQADQGWGKLRNLVHCQQCGAELTYPQGAVATSCPYCGSNSVNVTVSESNLFQPQSLLPFSIKPDQLKQFTQVWLQDGWMHPSTLGEAARMDKFIPFYLPYWAFSTDISFDWQAEVAHTVTDRYYDDASKSWKTRTRIEWRWENGSVQKKYTNLLICGVNPKRLNSNILDELQPFDMSKLVAFNPDYLAGINANAFDIDLNTAWGEAKIKLREAARELAIRDASNRQVRNLTIDMSYADENWRYLFLPVYIAVYLYEGKSYQVMVNGQTGKIFGQKPIDWKKVWTAIILALAPGLLLMLIGLPFILLAGSGLGVIFIGFILLLIGGAIGFSIYSKATRLEAL
ncbi:MAG: hypothetical protein AAGU15_08100 [Anaerolineaceae bacterium]|jgi:DNA-directed RNA polymerase subunit RPC12/RpoP